MPLLDPRKDLARAAQRIAAGALVAFPTETVYGLGARADDDAAVEGIFDAKGRPRDHPLIVHVASPEAAEWFCDPLPQVALRLMRAFWPGPLTLIVPRREGRGAAAAARQSTIGLRCPAHPVARALIEACRGLGVRGIAAPSANRFGRVSPTTAQHVVDEFGAELWVLDDGPCPIGIESTIVDCTDHRVALLRPGGLDRREIEALLGTALASPDEASPRASGTLPAHYAPRAVLEVLDAAELTLRRDAPGLPGGLGVYSRTVLRWPEAVSVRRMPDDAAGAAHELFAVLRVFDAQGRQRIWVERPPADPAWEGVRDRLQRAAAA